MDGAFFTQWHRMKLAQNFQHESKRNRTLWIFRSVDRCACIPSQSTVNHQYTRISTIRPQAPNKQVNKVLNICYRLLVQLCKFCEVHQNCAVFNEVVPRAATLSTQINSKTLKSEENSMPRLMVPMLTITLIFEKETGFLLIAECILLKLTVTPYINSLALV